VGDGTYTDEDHDGTYTDGDGAGTDGNGSLCGEMQITQTIATKTFATMFIFWEFMLLSCLLLYSGGERG